MIVLALICLALAALYAGVTFVNLAVFRAPAQPGPEMPLPAVSVLVPARDEGANIGPALDAILASEGIEFEAVVLDDDSTDDTAALVAERARRDPRVRLIRGRDLPGGWIGKQHACWQLSQTARNPVLVFVDADVRLAPDALARIAGYMEAGNLDLASGFPRQRTETFAEKLVIPQIFVMLLGYLPLPMARTSSNPGFGAACGQLMAIRRTAYARSGGHETVRAAIHDGLALPRLIRETGGRTDIFDATPLATCRMYETWGDVWAGFGKNATEGMAKSVALPVWTILLGGGHILPYVLVLAAWISGRSGVLEWSLLALALMLAARIATAFVVRQSPLSVAAHPVGIAIVLAIQWSALTGARRGRRATWRGRSYDVG